MSGRGRKATRRSRRDGKPEQITKVGQAMLAAGRETMPARIRGNAVEIRRIDAVIAKQFESALNGSPYSLNRVLERFEAAEKLERAAIAFEVEAAEARADALRAQIARAQANGESEPELLPHPDDIVIDHAKGVDYVGPLSQEEMGACRRTAALRDALILQDALERRLAGRGRVPGRDERPGAALRLANLANISLPPRLQRDAPDMVRRMDMAAHMTKRKLLKATRAAFREAGESMSRGKVLPERFNDPEVLKSVMRPVIVWWKDGMRSEEIYDVLQEIADALLSRGSAA